MVPGHLECNCLVLTTYTINLNKQGNISNFLENSATLIFFYEDMLVEKLRKINITTNLD